MFYDAAECFYAVVEMFYDADESFYAIAEMFISLTKTSTPS